ncbi:MAG: class I SAM-dependent methyltransferase [Hyphomicrobium sp.]
MPTIQTLPHDLKRGSAPRFTMAERVLARALSKAFGHGCAGGLDVVFPSGAEISVGGNGARGRLRLTSLKPVLRLATRGGLGLAESYMRGEIETADLRQVLRFLADNYTTMEEAGGGIAKPRLIDIVHHRRRDNTRAGSRRNIAAHYDLGNAFYKLWLDDGMTYSSAIYRAAEQSIGVAQEEKYRVVLDCIGAKSGDRLLEFGCGWGGLAERAAKLGVHVTGLTLSREQLLYARERMSTAGLDGLCDLRFEDYRDSRGDFDCMASVEMIEAVGEAHWPHYFATIAARLKPGGRAGIQAITIDERYFETYRRHTDFIQRYIFPGGMLPSVTRMREEATRAGLTFEIIERFGQSYALTLAEWRRRFIAEWPNVKALGFDDRFYRMWIYYLTYCEVGFARGDCDVGIYRLTKPR